MDRLMPRTVTEHRVTWRDPTTPGELYAQNSPSPADLAWLATRPNTVDVRRETRQVTYGDWVEEV
jgi:hypothetical protein